MEEAEGSAESEVLLGLQEGSLQKGVAMQTESWGQGQLKRAGRLLNVQLSSTMECSAYKQEEQGTCGDCHSHAE